MFSWLRAKKTAAIDSQICDARNGLLTIRLIIERQAHKGNKSIMLYAQGIVDTISLISERLNITKIEVVECKSLNWREIDDTAMSLNTMIEELRPKLKSNINSVRDFAFISTSGALIFHYFYKMLFLRTRGNEQQNLEIENLITKYRQYIQVMSEIGCGNVAPTHYDIFFNLDHD